MTISSSWKLYFYPWFLDEDKYENEDNYYSIGKIFKFIRREFVLLWMGVFIYLMTDIMKRRTDWMTTNLTGKDTPLSKWIMLLGILCLALNAFLPKLAIGLMKWGNINEKKKEIVMKKVEMRQRGGDASGQEKKQEKKKDIVKVEIHQKVDTAVEGGDTQEGPQQRVEEGEEEKEHIKKNIINIKNIKVNTYS